MIGNRFIVQIYHINTPSNQCIFKEIERVEFRVARSVFDLRSIKKDLLVVETYERNFRTIPSLGKGCQIFLGTTDQNGEYVPNDEIYTK
jgi:hypothetical protein